MRWASTRFDLLGISQGGAVAVAYAARHPERVSHLILLWRVRARAGDTAAMPQEIEARTALIKLCDSAGGRNNPAFRQIFTTRFIPDAGPEQMEWFNDLQRVSASPENAARFMEDFSRLDVRALLAEHQRAHYRLALPRRRRGPVRRRASARRRPSARARFVPLPSRNHLLLEHEPAWQILLRELGDFLGWQLAS